MPRLGLSLLVLGLLAVAAAYGAAFADAFAAVAPFWLALGSTTVLAGLAVLGAARGGRPTPRLHAAAGVAFACVALGFVLPLAQPAPDAGTPLLLGLPRPTTILLLLAGLVPLVVLPLAYAAAFPREVLDEPPASPPDAPR